jgi:CRISPR type III-A-associated protein Csm2
MEQEILKNYFNGISIDQLINPVTYDDSELVIQIINCVEKTMKEYAKKITYTQLRNIYGLIRDVKTVVDIHKVRPKIAYIQARLDNDEAKQITEFIMDIIKLIKENEQIIPFKELMETMVAFHKQYNTKNN